MTKRLQKNINGILLLDKPLHMTSNGALQRVKRLFEAKKAGHTGSLDPLATGMLPLCFGEATKFSQFLLESDKNYQVTIKLGVQTTTGDAEGEIIATKPVSIISSEDLSKVLSQFEGTIQQIPPMFSAIKVQGRPLYELARKGIEIDRQPRTVHIRRMRLLSYTQDLLELDIYCSKGTYIRTLAEDIGKELECGAHVISLRRTMVSPYDQAKMYTIEELEDMHQQNGSDALTKLLIPIETSVQTLHAIKLSTSAQFYLRTGQPVIVPHLPTEGMIRLYSQANQFLGIGEIMEDGRVTPRRLISQPDKMTRAV
ncbi:MAG: tRNA pseudouridine(55) synthase TruB [Gammaproteobacteria bacterium]|nr:tRNA pseudouridine(55) synthase TruB [Gammaproteobacteria bacterium]